MVKLLCNQDKGGCGCIYEVDEKRIVNDEFIQCAICGRICENPLYKKRQ